MAAFPTFIILQSLADTTFFKRAVLTDTQTYRHTEPINGSKFRHSTSRLMSETINYHKNVYIYAYWQPLLL